VHPRRPSPGIHCGFCENVHTKKRSTERCSRERQIGVLRIVAALTQNKGVQFRQQFDGPHDEWDFDTRLYPRENYVRTSPNHLI